FLEEFADSEVVFVAGDYLAAGRDGLVTIYMYVAALRLERAHDELKNRAFSGAVLAHERDFGAAAHRKIHFLEDGLVVAVSEGHFFESYLDITCGHPKNVQYI